VPLTKGRNRALTIDRLRGLLTSAADLLFCDPAEYPPDFSKTLPDPAQELEGKSQAMSTRRASHSGSWYLSDAHALGRELDDWLARAAPAEGSAHSRAIIGPHAGYRYCGACGGHAYARIHPEKVKRVFILGPSHHVRLSGCALSACSKYQTPFYDLTIDRSINNELMATDEFEVMSLEADEDEHSIEMHLPYIARVMQRQSPGGSPPAFTVVPVLVGSLSPDKEARYGRIFAKYLADPQNLFIVSSDFCHWGSRFRYTEYDDSKGPIHEYIKHLDYEGMQIIESMDHGAFSAYLKRTGNTICGRHPIGVFLGAVNALKANKAMINGFRMDLQFLNYDQSNAAKNMRDSSVSYAAAVYTLG